MGQNSEQGVKVSDFSACPSLREVVAVAWLSLDGTLTVLPREMSEAS